MYNFTDTKQVPSEGLNRPAEAVKINGSWLEDLVEGYSTLYTSGRDSLEKTIVEYEATKADGSQIKYTKFPPRTIVVGFQLLSSSAQQLRNRLNDLNSALNTENAEIIFNDEPDKYFTGCPVFNAEPEPGSLCFTGEWEIFCADPFKYALEETEFQAVSLNSSGDDAEYDSTQTYNAGDVVKHNGILYECIATITTPEAWNASHWKAITGRGFLVNNNGGYRAFPRIEIRFGTDESGGSIGSGADCGFVQLAKGEHRLQFGDDEQEQHNFAVRVNQDFTKALGTFTNAASGTLVPGTTWQDKASATVSTNGLKPAYGTLSKEWHGSFLTAPAAAATDFSLEWQQCLALSSTASTAKTQKAAFAILALNANNDVVAGIRIEKKSSTSTNATMTYIVENEVVNTETVSLKNSGPLGYDTSGSTKKKRRADNKITRTEGLVTFDLATNETTFDCFRTSDSAITKIGVFFGQYSTAKTPTINNLLTAKFIDGGIGNTFKSGDLLNIDCSSAEAVLNDKNAIHLEDAGNAWSDFYMDPGLNTVEVIWSDWDSLQQFPPVPTLYLRKRWI